MKDKEKQTLLSQIHKRRGKLLDRREDFMNRKYELMVIYRAEDDNGYQEGNDWVTEKVQSYQGK